MNTSTLTRGLFLIASGFIFNTAIAADAPPTDEQVRSITAWLATQ